MHKLEEDVAGQSRVHSHNLAYESLSTESQSPRLFFGFNTGVPDVFLKCALALQPPFHLLYILHTSRGEADRGRYQSEAIDAEQLANFFSSYRKYFTADGRFDLWAHSVVDRATVVWDRHNYIHAHGPLDRYVPVLLAAGYRPGDVDRVSQRAHSHFYRPEFDVLADSILNEFDWVRSPQQPEDEQ